MTTVFEEGAPRESHPGPRGAEYIADPAEYVGLPAPDLGAVAAHTDADALRTRIRRVIRSRDVGQLSAEEATEAILDHIAAYRLRQPNRGAYTHRVTVRADELEAPSTGPKWQVLDARDEVTWHDLEAVVDCNLGERCPDKVAGKECVVLIGKAWADGFAHAPEDTPVVVRIPAAVNL